MDLKFPSKSYCFSHKLKFLPSRFIRWKVKGEREGTRWKLGMQIPVRGIIEVEGESELSLHSFI